MFRNAETLKCLVKDKIKSLLKNLNGIHVHDFDIPEVRSYFDVAAPFLYEIACECPYYAFPQLTTLLQPYIVTKGRFHLSDLNICEVVKWQGKDKANFEQFVTYLKVDILSGRHYFQLLGIIGCLKNLKVIILWSWTSDDILAVIGVTCKNLEIFDAREDAASSVTNIGIGFLSQCKKLRYVLFSNVGDEYDFEDRFPFTGKAVALLLITVPSIVRLDCPQYLLRDAILYLYQFNNSGFTVPVKSLHLGFNDVTAKAVCSLPYVCPSVEVLSIYIGSDDEASVGCALKKLTKLKVLTLTLEDHHNLSLLSLSCYGSNLVYLELCLPCISYTDLIMLSATCCNIETLIFHIYSCTFKDEGLSENCREVLFPKVKTLELVSSVSTDLFVYLNSKIRGLQKLYCVAARVSLIENAILHIIQLGGWSNLELLVLPDTMVFHLENVLPFLKPLSKLKCLSLTLETYWDYDAELLLFKYIKDHNLGVILKEACDIARPCHWSSILPEL